MEDEPGGGLYGRVTQWYAESKRPLPWREDGTSAWGVLVSEVMSQQTPVARVAGPWREWMRRWPTPADLAGASPADVLRAWDRLGYPRRALRLREAARVIAARHGNRVPSSEEQLLALPGVGHYTAAAVMAFAHGRRALPLDTNVRRFLARVVAGQQYPPAAVTAAERKQAWALVPQTDAEAALWAQAAMELGALVCTARSPQCHRCPVAADCRWLRAGRPEGLAPRKTQPWRGTDRQCRGRIMATLRAADAPVPTTDLAWADRCQLDACVRGLVADGLACHDEAGLTLPAGPGDLPSS